MVVLLPAPFGPKNPTMSPLSSENVTSFTAFCSPNFFNRFFTWIDMRSHGVVSFETKIGVDRYAQFYGSLIKLFSSLHFEEMFNKFTPQSAAMPYPYQIRSLEEYQKQYQQSVEQPEEFWGDVAQHF